MCDKLKELEKIPSADSLAYQYKENAYATMLNGIIDNIVSKLSEPKPVNLEIDVSQIKDNDQVTLISTLIRKGFTVTFNGIQLKISWSPSTECSSCDSYSSLKCKKE